MFSEQKYELPEKDSILTNFSSANDSSREGISINQLSILASDNYTSTEKLEMHLNKIIEMGMLSYEESTKRYKITKRGLYNLKFYAVTGIDIFNL